jgi:protein-S-isoprenylcysteine O-methyltransferase Ste14
MTRVLPLLGLLLFVGVGFGWRTWLQWRRFGNTGFMLFRSGRWPQHVREALLLVLLGVLSWQAVAAVRAPDRLAHLWLIEPDALLTGLGFALMVGGTALMAAAQLDLGASWRIGIEEDARPGLVVGGLYRFSRNPIFLAMFVSLLGFTLLLPTWISAAALLGTVAGVHNQVRDEEDYLLRAYGAAYGAYAAAVGRFVPGIGRLRVRRTT